MTRRGDRALHFFRAFVMLGTAIALVLSLVRFVDVDRLELLGLVPVAPFLVSLGLLVLGATYGIRLFGSVVVLLAVSAALLMPGTVLPRTGCSVAADRDPSSLVVFSHNLLVSNQATDDVARQLLSVDPDVVLLQEAPSPVVDALVLELDGNYPHRETVGLQSILSRWPLTDVSTTGTNTGGAVIATATSPDHVVRIANFHASAPLQDERRKNQRLEFASMMQWRISESVDVVMGDFNAGGAQPLYRDAVGDGFVDAHRSAGCGFGLTWKRSGTTALLSLDHALIHERHSVDGFEVLGYAGSDHKAIAVEFRLAE